MNSESTALSLPTATTIRPKQKSDEPQLQSFTANNTSSTTSTEDPPIKFTVDSIPKHLTGEFVSLMARRFYSDDEWSQFSDYQRAVIVSKAVTFRNHNKSGVEDSDTVDMSKPNPFALMDNGIESWPSASSDLEFSDIEKNAYMAITWKAVHDKLAQRCWGDRFYHGKINLGQRCSHCTVLQIDCVRKDNGVTCLHCSQYRSSRPGPEGRCQHLERYYVDYASRHLNIELSVSLALFKATGGPSRTHATAQKKRRYKVSEMTSGSPLPGGSSQGSRKRTSISEPAVSSPGRISARPYLRAPNSLRRRTYPGPKGYAPGRRRWEPSQRASPSPDSASSTSSIIEVSRPHTPAASLTESASRAAKRPRLGDSQNAEPTANGPTAGGSMAIVSSVAHQPTQAPESSQTELQILQQRFDALRSLSQTYFHQVSEVHTRLEISIPSLFTAVEATPQVLEPFMKHKERLRVASLEFCRGLMTVDGPSS